MYSNFHLDVFTTLVYVFLDWKRQREDDLSSVFRDVTVVLKKSRDFQNFT